MPAILSPNAKQQFFTDGSTVAAGYKLFTYVANGAPSPQVTYVNRAGTVENQNPITLDARGEAIIYLVPGLVYDYVLTTPEGSTVWTREDVIADAGDANAVSFQQAGAGAVARSIQDKGREWVSPEDFGAVGDGFADDMGALQAAAAQCLATGQRLRLGQNKAYWVGAGTPFTMPAITVQSESGASIRGNVELHTDAKFVGTLTTVRNDSVNEYIPFDFVPDYKKPKTVEPTFQGEGDADRSTTGAVDLTLTFHERISWPGSDSWAAFTPDLSSSVISGKNLTNDGFFYGDFIAAEGGMEINTTFDDVPCTRACIIRHTGGVMMFYCQQDGNGTIAQKNLGVAATTVATGITWAGKADHVSWLPSNSEFTIRLYDLRTWSVLLNGREIIAPQTIPAGHFITLAGFGVAWDGSNVTGAQRYWTKVVSQHSSGRGFLDLIVVGDSTSADVHGAYPDFLRNYLDGSFGYNVQQIRNYAQDGATSAIQLATLTANGVLGATDVIVNVGTNDVQNPGAAGDLNACLANVQSIINLCVANNKRCTGVIFPTWYNKSHSGNKGVTTFNYELSALYRSAYRHKFASNNCQIVDLNMELRSPLGSDVGNTYIDPGLRDNIHWTPRRAMAAAWAIAKRIAGYTPKKTRALAQISLPTSLLKNSWVINGAAGIALDSNALVTLTGRIDGGTKADGTQIMLLPPNMVPKVQQVYRARSDAGNAVTVIIATSGSVTCFGVGADAGIHLDGISFYTN